MNLVRIIAGLMLVLCSCIALAQAEHKFYKAPSWVHNKKPDIDRPVPVDQVKAGRHFLLVDNQIRVSKSGNVAGYHHFAEHMVNQNGLENASQISIDFDPTYKAVYLHKLQVWRKGKIIDKRASARITLIQPEREAKDLVYNGQQSLNIILDDIRVGDTIEYSYSRNGRNPVYGGVFDIVRPLQWTVPVGEIYERIIWHKAKPLNFKRNNTDVAIKKLQRVGATEYIIKARDMPAISLDDDTPGWFDPYASVYFSETKNWRDVARWGETLFAQAIRSSPAIRQLADNIRQAQAEPAQQIAAALQYVQANVRYLGLELGVNSHFPSSPDVTLQRRYGDCKDKSSLYIALLRELGFTAYPALVNTHQYREIKKRLPAYGAFDHVIVKVIHDNKHYWFDPTRQYQLGSTADIFQPDYGYALVLQPDSPGLESMDNLKQVARVVEQDVFMVDVRQRDQVRYAIKTTHYGLEAEYQRDLLADTGAETMRKNYLDFYKSYYPGIKTASDAVFSDNVDNGEFISNEKYVITDFWKQDEEGNRFTADLYATSLLWYLEEPVGMSREHPYQLPYPVNYKHTIVVNFAHDDWFFEKASFTEDNDFFYYQSDSYYDRAKRQLHLNYFFRTKTDVVPPERYKDYVSRLKRAYNDASYALDYRFTETSASNVSEGENNWFPENIWIITLVIYVLLVGFAIVLWVLADKKHATCTATQYYPVSIPKFLFMWFMTLGLYGVYWFYKNFAYIKRRDGSSIMPVARGLFNIFWYYSLYKDLILHKSANTMKATLPPQFVGVLFAVTYFISSFISNRTDKYFMVYFIVAGLLLVPMVNYIYHVNDQDSSDSRYNSRLSFRHAVLTVIGLPVFLLLISSDIGLTASDSVVTGDKLYSHDLKYLQRKGILKPDDKVDYFYSDAFIFIRDDGNGFTDRHVFSYWKEDGELRVEQASFDEIEKIDITWSKSFVDNTVINIVRKDKTEFLLYVSHTSKKDKVFGKELKRRWQQVVKSL